MLGLLAVLAMTACLMHCSGQSAHRDSQKGNLLFMIEADESLEKAAKAPTSENEAGYAPEGTEWIVIRGGDLLVNVKPAMTGECVAKAEAVSEGGRWELDLTFTPEGKETFGKVTSGNIDKHLAIVYNGVCISAPLIWAKMLDGRAVITGTFTEQEARDMAEALNSGR
jgi:preprotein translocase subunit SecD